MHLCFALDFLLDRGGQSGRWNPQLLQDRWNQAFALRQQRRQQMFGVHRLIGIAPGHLLRLFQRFLRLNRQAIHLHLI